MKDAKASIEEAIQVLDDNTGSYDALLRASGRAMGLLGNALVALESEEVVAEVWLEPRSSVDPSDYFTTYFPCRAHRTGDFTRYVRIVAVKEE